MSWEEKFEEMFGTEGQDDYKRFIGELLSEFTLATCERDLIVAALKLHQEKKAAAAMLGIGRRTIYWKIDKHQIEDSEWKS